MKTQIKKGDIVRVLVHPDRTRGGQEATVIDVMHRSNGWNRNLTANVEFKDGVRTVYRVTSLELLDGQTGAGTDSEEIPEAVKWKIPVFIYVCARSSQVDLNTLLAKVACASSHEIRDPVPGVFLKGVVCVEYAESIQEAVVRFLGETELKKDVIAVSSGWAIRMNWHHKLLPVSSSAV